MNEPNEPATQPHLESALRQLNTHRHALEAELEPILAAITAIKQRLLGPANTPQLSTTNPNLSPPHTEPTKIPLTDPEETDYPPLITANEGPRLPPTPETALRIVTPVESTIPDGRMNAGPCPNTTDGNHIANDAGRCVHCGSDVTTPI
jgi:hypothetical protein